MALMTLALVTATMAALVAPQAPAAQSSAQVCNELARKHPEILLWPNSTQYASERVRYWDVRSDQSPACIFLAQHDEHVVELLQTCRTNGAYFAVRGGGHMNYPGSNNIDSGVLLTLNALNNTKLTDDKSSIIVGPGNRWVDVYSALAADGLYAIGGRLKTIGVPGLTLIGGHHYFNNKYGYAMDNVLSYDIVLGNGSQVVANRSVNADLFWALKGGANNFGIVTSFELKTIFAPNISTTIQAFDGTQVEAFIRAVCDFTIHDDPTVGAGAVFNIQYNATTKALSASVLGVQEGDVSPPPQFSNFTALPAVRQIHNVTTPLQWASQLDSPNQMFRVQFAHHTMKPDADQLIKFMRRWIDAVDQVADVAGLYPTFVMNTMAASAHNVANSNGVGNVWGLTEKTGPLIIYQTSTGWSDASDDIRMTQWSRYMVEDMHRLNQELGLAHEYIYMGDAGEWQNPWLGMPANNVQRMKDISRAYDPDMVFQKLNYGGFKLGF